MMTIKITSEEELKQVAAELLHVMVNLRHYSKAWHEYHGGALLATKKTWEIRADELLKKLEVEYTMNSTVKSYKIEIEKHE